MVSGGRSWLMSRPLLCSASFTPFQLVILQRAHPSVLQKSKNSFFFFPVTYESFQVNSEIFNPQILVNRKVAAWLGSKSVSFRDTQTHVQILASLFFFFFFLFGPGANALTFLCTTFHKVWTKLEA